MAKKKTTETVKGAPASASVFESLLFVAVAATILAIIFLALSLSRYEWALPA
jgi:hypothetical protein